MPAVRVERVRDPGVHHLHGVPLPEEHLLDGVVRGDALGVKRDHDVHAEAGRRKETRSL